MVKLVMLVLILCTACQSGLIPCPKVKTAQIKRSSFQKHHLLQRESLTAEANDTQGSVNNQKRYLRAESKSISNISVEEWDCPKLGSKRYMPKSIKENIKRNFKKLNSNLKKVKADSVRNTSRRHHLAVY